MVIVNHHSGKITPLVNLEYYNVYQLNYFDIDQ